MAEEISVPLLLSNVKAMVVAQKTAAGNRLLVSTDATAVAVVSWERLAVHEHIVYRCPLYWGAIKPNNTASIAFSSFFSFD